VEQFEPGRIRITERDRELLQFASCHRLVLAAQVQVLLGVSRNVAQTRLRGLTKAGFLTREQPFHARPGHYQITRRGLGLIGSDLPRPGDDLRSYEHDIGLGWLWLTARSGRLGPVREVISERELRSHDGHPDGRSRPLAVRLGGSGPHGRDRLHYPDLLLVGTDGSRVATELELSHKGRSRWHKILSGYAVDARVSKVLYLVHSRPIADGVQRAARRLGISDRVRVQRVRAIGFGRAARAKRSAAAVRTPDRDRAVAAR
jgi:hypothetical protein